MILIYDGNSNWFQTMNQVIGAAMARFNQTQKGD